jgi:hypothetical protein
LAVYPPEVSKSGNLSLPLKWIEILFKKNKIYLRAISSFHSFPSSLTEKVDRRFKLSLFEISGGKLPILKLFSLN